jgi:RHS repeat-associated protein
MLRPAIEIGDVNRAWGMWRPMVVSDRGRMVSSTRASQTTSYKYNGAGQRVSKAGPTTIIETGTNYYVYDEAGQMLGEYDANAKPIQETVYLGEMPLAVIKQETNTTTNQIDTKVNYIHTDHLNTPRVITRAEDGKVVWKWVGEAFGTTPAQENPSNLGPQAQFVYNPRFPGQMYDRETNLHYNYFRDYDPQLGRYVQSDPIGLAAGTTQTFGYVYSNPTGLFDTDGLMGRGGYSVESYKYGKGGPPATYCAKPESSAGIQNKTVLYLGPVELNFTSKDSGGSMYAGVRAPGLGMGNFTEFVATGEAMAGPTIKASGGLGLGFYLQGSVAVSTGDGSTSGGFSATGGFGGRTDRFYGVAPPSPGIGWTIPFGANNSEACMCVKR